MESCFNFDSIIEEVGQSVTSHLPDGWCSSPYRALIQPLRYKNKMYLEGEYTPIGHSHHGYYLYIGPASHDITLLGDSAFIRTSEQKFVIDRAERCYLGDRITHIWAILRNTEETVQ